MKDYLYKNRFIIFLFLCYTAVVFFLTQYQPGMAYRPDLSGSRVRTNFEPFIQINEAINRIKAIGLPGGAEASKREVIKYIVTTAFGFFANVAMFIPLGILLPMLSKKLDGLIRVTAIGFFLSLVIELCQVALMMVFITDKRAFDIDDLIANTMGAVIGYIIFVVIRVLVKSGKRALETS